MLTILMHPLPPSLLAGKQPKQSAKSTNMQVRVPYKSGSKLPAAFGVNPHFDNAAR